MIPTTDLFDLIKSLNKHEKGAFKKYAVSTIRDGGNIKPQIPNSQFSYLQLFDAINKQKQYDEKKLLKLLKKKTGAQFWEKNYLYNMILKSLELYNQSINSKLSSYRNQIEILFNKGLYKQCEKILLRAKQLAIQYDYGLPLIDFLRWEITLMRAQSYMGKTEKGVDKVFTDLFHALDNYKIENKYSLVSSKLFVKNIQKGFPRNKGELQEYKEILDHNIKKKASSYIALHADYYGKMFFAYINNDYQSAYNYALRCIQLIEANPHQIKENPIGYISALNELMVYQGHLKKYEETLITLKKLEIIPMKSLFIRNQIFRIRNDMALATYICTGDFDKGVALIHEIEYELQKSIVQLPSKQSAIVLEYNMACIYFGAKNYSLANKYLYKILNETTTDLDIHCFAQILSLIVHFELGKEDLLEYAVKSTFRYLYKKKRLYQFETLILNFVRGLPKIPSQKELITSFKELKNQIEELLKIPYENKIINYFDFISWLESKIKNRHFDEVVKEKANSH